MSVREHLAKSIDVTGFAVIGSVNLSLGGPRQLVAIDPFEFSADGNDNDWALRHRCGPGSYRFRTFYLMGGSYQGYSRVFRSGKAAKESMVYMPATDGTFDASEMRVGDVFRWGFVDRSSTGKVRNALERSGVVVEISETLLVIAEEYTLAETAKLARHRIEALSLTQPTVEARRLAKAQAVEKLTSWVEEQEAAVARVSEEDLDALVA